MMQATEMERIGAGLRVEKGLETAVPLRNVRVRGKINPFAAEVSVQHVYENLSGKNIEAIYIFPLPEESAVTGLLIRAGDRVIRGQIMDREEAFEKYDAAVWEGHGAALLDQTRPNIFEAAVGNIRPKEKIEIEIIYVERTAYDSGAYRFRLPTVVGPRYIPGVPDGDRTGHGVADPTGRVPDADHLTPPVVDGDPGYRVSVDLLFAMPMGIKTVESTTHPIKIEMVDAKTARVTLAQGEAVPDRDLVVLCRTEEGIQAGALCHREKGKDGTVALVFHPAFEGEAASHPKSVVFVVDHSGSMSGKKMEQARNALRICLRALNEGDLFTMIKFDTTYKTFSQKLLPFNQENLEKADKWISRIEAEGGTEILEPLRTALRSFDEAPEQRFVVILTDGQVGNEEEILRMMEKEGGGTRIFTFGIDSAVNSHLLTELARAGHGQAEFITPWERVDDKVAAQFQRIGQPQVTEVRIDWGGLDVHDVVPDPLPPVFAGEPLTLMARYRGPGKGTVSITAEGLQGKISAKLDLELPEADEQHGSLPILWARERIQRLERAKRTISTRRQKEVEKLIRELALEHGLMSAYTSFVAIEEREGEAVDGLPEAKMVPVALPGGWEREERLYACKSGRSVRSEAFGKNMVSHGRAPITRHRAKPIVVEHFAAEGYSEPVANHAELLRILARNQNADGSWGHGSAEQIMSTTALALLAFVGEDGDLESRLYQAQIKKGFQYLEKAKINGDLATSALVFWALLAHAAKVDNKSLRESLNERAAKLQASLLGQDVKEYLTRPLLLSILLAWEKIEGQLSGSEAVQWRDEWNRSELMNANPAKLSELGMQLTKDEKLMPLPLMVYVIILAMGNGLEKEPWQQWLQSYMIGKLSQDSEEVLVDEIALVGAAMGVLDGDLFVIRVLRESKVKGS